MNNPLTQLGNVPVSASVLKSLFPQIARGDQKVRLLERDKQIIRLKRGVYVCSLDITGKELSTELIANHLYTPSYVSMSSALRFYGLIPETVYTTQSMTLKHSRAFATPLGRFEYIYLPRQVFSIGLTNVKKDDYSFVMATPEKALCDLVASSSGVNFRYLKEAETYLEEDIRMEMEDFKQMDVGIFKEYIKVGKKAESIQLLLKLLER